MGSYVPSTLKEQKEMLESIGLSSIDELFSHIPDELKLKSELNIPSGKSEMEVSRTILRVQIDTINVLWLSFFNLRKHHNICTFSFFPAHPHGIGYRFSTCNSRLSSRVLSY